MRFQRGFLQALDGTDSTDSLRIWIRRGKRRSGHVKGGRLLQKREEKTECCFNSAKKMGCGFNDRYSARQTRCGFNEAIFKSMDARSSNDGRKTRYGSRPLKRRLSLKLIMKALWFQGYEKTVCSFRQCRQVDYCPFFRKNSTHDNWDDIDIGEKKIATSRFRKSFSLRRKIDRSRFLASTVLSYIQFFFEAEGGRSS